MVTFFLRQITELHYAIVSIARSSFVLTSMPHDSFQHISCTTVVQTFHTTTTFRSQSPTPQRSSATPSCADIVLHPQTMLNKIGIWPNLLVRIAGHIAVRGSATNGRRLHKGFVRPTARKKTQPPQRYLHCRSFHRAYTKMNNER